MTDFDAKLFSIVRWSPYLVGTVWYNQDVTTFVQVVAQDDPDSSHVECVHLRGWPASSRIHAYQSVDVFMREWERTTLT